MTALRYDLHVHSNVSDGAFTPSTVVERALEARLDGFALTDHDSTAGFEEAVAAAAGRIDVLLGCEVSSRWGDIGVHMLAYFMDPENPAWLETLQWIRDDRVVRAAAMVEKLNELGVPVTMDQVREIAKGESIGRPHVAQALVDAGIVERTPDAFTPEWIGDGGRAYVEKRVASPHDTVRVVREAGGVAVVAHAIWVDREGGDVEQLIEELVDAGLGGLEVDHPEHDLDTRKRFAKLADRYDLVMTASSDYHGNDHGGILGSNTAGEEVVAALRARATAPVTKETA